MLAPFRAQLSAVMDEPIGKPNGVFARNSAVERTGSVPLGDLVTDSMRAQYGTQLALTNGGGLRSAIPSSYVVLDAGMPVVRTGCSSITPCDVVRGDIFSVLPFGNVVVTRTVTGNQLRNLMEYGLAAAPAVSGRFPQISGFRAR